MKHAEYKLQCDTAELLRAILRQDVLWTHIPLQGTADAKRGAQLKAMGVQPGWPDFLIMWGEIGISDEGVWPVTSVLAIEMKTAGGRLSPAQEKFETSFVAVGKYSVCRSLEDVGAVLKRCGVPTRGKLAA